MHLVMTSWKWLYRRRVYKKSAYSDWMKLLASKASQEEPISQVRWPLYALLHRLFMLISEVKNVTRLLASSTFDLWWLTDNISVPNRLTFPLRWNRFHFNSSFWTLKIFFCMLSKILPIILLITAKFLEILWKKILFAYCCWVMICLSWF